MIFSALYNVDQKAEAAKYLRIVVAYDSSYRELLEQCENDDNTSQKSGENESVSSRRAD